MQPANPTGNVTADATLTGGERVTRDIVAPTELASEEGAAQGVQFAATEGMTRYVCVVYPTTMIGDIEIATDTATPGQRDTVAVVPARHPPTHATRVG